MRSGVFWYKADFTPDFKIGADPYWNYSRHNFVSDGQAKVKDSHGSSVNDPLR